MAQKLGTAEAINQTFSFVRKEFMPLLLAMNVPVVLMVATGVIQWQVFGLPTHPLELLPTWIVSTVTMIGYSMAVYQRVVLGKKITALATFRLFTRKGLRVVGFEVIRLVLLGLACVCWIGGAVVLERVSSGSITRPFGAVVLGLVCMFVFMCFFTPLSFVSSMYACVRNPRLRFGVRLTKGYRISVFWFWILSVVVWVVIAVAADYATRVGMGAFTAGNAVGTGLLLGVVVNNLILMTSTAYWAAGSALFFRNAAKRMIADKKYGGRTVPAKPSAR